MKDIQEVGKTGLELGVGQGRETLEAEGSGQIRM